MRNRCSRTITILLLSLISAFLVHGCLDDDHHFPRRPPDNVLIPYSCFYMGDYFYEGDLDEVPYHQVCTSSFRMDKYEVTNGKYKACVDAGACTAPSHSNSFSRGSYYGAPAYADYPVVIVSWGQAAAYCAWAGKRLPTEAEWEHAARRGLAGKRYPDGDTITCADASYGRHFSGEPCWDYGGLENDTQRVGTYAPNGLGLYDMAGNVQEWVNDYYQSDYYSVGPPMDPPGPLSGAEYVIRGGSFLSDASSLRVASRNSGSELSWYTYTGFRCAADY